MSILASSRPLQLAAAFLLVAAAAPAFAQTAPDTNPADVQSGVYGVEPTHTRVLFAVSHMGFTTWYGEFTHASGTLSLSPRGVASSTLEIHLPTVGISTSNGILDGELKSADWFDAAKFPGIVFKATRVVQTGTDTADITGDLTLHGVTRPIVLKAKFNASGVNPLSKKYTVGFEVAGVLKRSEFGVVKYVPLVGDEVKLIISAAFEKP